MKTTMRTRLAGLFKWIGVLAYEEDVEDVMNDLAEIKTMPVDLGGR